MIKVDTNVADFNAALRAYYAASKYEWSDIVNRKALQLAFEALGQTEKAERQMIQAVEKEEWWPKYVAKRIMSGVTFRTVTTKKGVRHEKVTTFKGNFTREEAKEASKRIIAARVRSIAFFKSGWLPAIRTLWPRVRDKPYVRKTTSGSRQYGKDKGRAVVARPSVNPFAEIVNSAGAQGYSKAIHRDVRTPGMQRALQAVTADTLEYVARKNRKVAERFLRLR